MALQWARLDWVRHAIDLVAWLAALRTFALFYTHGEELVIAEERSEKRRIHAEQQRQLERS